LKIKIILNKNQNTWTLD